MEFILYTACFTGHRPKNFSFGLNETHSLCLKIKEQLKKQIKELIELENVTHFISGVALGVDTWAAEAVIELRNEYNHITLEAAIPCRSQADGWNAASKQRYQNILSQCDKITYVNEAYTRDCMMKRNKYMVDKSFYIIAVWNGKPSGTGSTIKYAKKNKRKICYIDIDGFNI